jgi:hypothetical protein
MMKAASTADAVKRSSASVISGTLLARGGV